MSQLENDIDELVDLCGPIFAFIKIIKGDIVVSQILNYGIF